MRRPYADDTSDLRNGMAAAVMALYRMCMRPLTRCVDAGEALGARSTAFLALVTLVESASARVDASPARGVMEAPGKVRVT